MEALVICECSDTVTDALKAVGVNARSCDLKPSEHNRADHIQADCRTLDYSGIDLVIAFPDCQYIASSGLHWNSRIPGRQQKTNEALDFVRWILGLPIKKIALENPVGCISTAIRKPDQLIQPYQFGENASKATCLWLKGLPKLKPTKYIEPHYRCRCGGLPFEYALGKYGCPNCNGEHIARLVWGNQTPSGQNNEPPGENQKANRARTYQGIAEAMASQWGGEYKI